MLCIDTDDPTWALYAQGHSGSNEPLIEGMTEKGTDNPIYEGFKDFGVIPAGGWYIGGPKFHRGMINWMDLEPMPGNIAFDYGRDNFAIHGAKDADPFDPTAGSTGCILVGPDPRERLADRVNMYGYGILYVYR